MTDLSRLRAVVKRWGPAVVSTSLGLVAGTGAVLVIGVVLRALDAGHALLVAALLAAACANALTWWMWGRYKRADVAAARAVHAQAIYDHHTTCVALDAAVKSNSRLIVENEQLRRSDVTSLLHERMGDQP